MLIKLFFYLWCQIGSYKNESIKLFVKHNKYNKMKFMSKVTKILALITGVLCIISCEKENNNSQRFESYFDYKDFVQEGLIAYYPFNGDVLDYSGNNHNGIDNSVSFSKDRFGYQSRAAKFNGIDSYITVPNSSAFNSGGYTVCFWYRPDSVQNDIERSILSKTDTLQGYAISTMKRDYTTRFVFYKAMLYNDALAYGSHGFLGSDNFFYRGHEEFIFMAVSFSDNQYIDWILGEHFTYTFGVPVTFIETDFDLLIGKSNLSQLSYAKGEIDDLLIYNRILTFDEVLKLSKWKNN